MCFLLASISLLACRNQPITKRRKVATVGVVAYLLALTPYVVRGAYLHGWAGGYVQMDCMRRLDELTAAVCDYADAHGGSLPTATGIDELIDVVQPYLKNGVQRFRSIPRAICPVGGAFERTPQKYRWDSKLSGRKLTELNEGTLMDEGMISCPYHQRQGVQSFTRIMKHRDVAASQPSSTPSDARTGMSR